MHVRKSGRRTISRPVIDKHTIVPLLACAFALIVFPLLSSLVPEQTQQLMMSGAEARPEPRIFWPALMGISIVLAFRDQSRLSKLSWPPHIVCLVAYLAFAGASVLWAFSPEHSLIRFLQQVMIATSIVLPAMLAGRSTDLMRGLFLCFALALILNLGFVLGGSVTMAQYTTGLVDIGYRGYFGGKNYLGECATVAFLLSLYEIRYRGWRRVFGAVILAIAILLIFLSDSKTAFGLALLCPFLAAFILLVRKITGISPAIILMMVPLCYAIASSVSHVSIMDRMAYMLYGDSTLTGRTLIWEFAQYEIAERPLLGWGYQSFWLVPDSPSSSAPGWVAMMPNAHNGYYDTMLELGHVGLAFLVVFVIATLHAIGRVADRDPAQARLVLSLVLFVILFNYFESLWMRGFEFLWVMFLVVAAEIGRYWRPAVATAGYRSRRPRPRSSGPAPGTGARMPRPGIG